MNDADAVEFRPIDRSQHQLLIIDDDPVSRYTTSRQLEAAGFRTRQAANGAEGLQMADETLSAIVLDVHLPDMDGFAVCRTLRQQPSTAALPVLHLTAAYVTDDDKVRGLDAGADAYLTHPVEPAVLVATVQALVRTRVAEEAMRRSVAKFKAIYTQAPSGICLIDPDGRLTDANPAMLALLRRPLSEVQSRALLDFVPREHADAAGRFVAELAERPARAEFPLLDPDGHEVLLEWTASPHIEPGVGMAVATDISSRLQLARQRQELLDRERSARSAAERTSRMKDNLIATLSHELRTPLNAIGSWTHVLKKRADPELLARGLEVIERNVNTQARMITDMLDMSRMNVGKLPLTLALVDPVEHLQIAVAAMRPVLDAAQHRLRLDLPAEPRPLLTDGARLQQIVWNLLSNAVKFSPAGSEVLLRVEQTPERWTLTVSDQGRGIPEAFLPHVFERFAQSDAASNRRHGGLGLGLAIVKHLVEAHGGEAAAFSAGEEQGATFRITLPWAGPTTPATSPSTPQDRAHDADPAPEAREADDHDASLAALRVLIVDDDPDACEMLTMILGERGAQVVTAHSYEQALSALSAGPVDALVSDVGLPDRDGHDLIREIRRREREAGAERLPAIAFTAFARPRDEAQALAAGFDGHCAKPLRPVQLVRLVSQLARPAPG